MNVPPILKNKWVWIGGGAVILIVLFMSGGSGGSATVGVSGPSPDEVAASRDITLAQMQLQGQQQAAQTQLAIAAQQGQNEVARMAMEMQLSQYALDAQAAMQSLQLNTSREVALADLASQERRELAAINSQTQLARWTLDQATANAQIQSDFQLQYAEAANSTQMFLAQVQAELVNNQLIVGRDVQLAGIASQEALAAINAASYQSMIAAQVEMNTVNALNETERMRIMQAGANRRSSNSLIGGIIGGVLGLFSDPRLKTNIRRVGSRPDGLGVYGFDYLWSGPEIHAIGPAFNPYKDPTRVPVSRKLGVMADEVHTLRPDALGGSVAGFRTVDYTRLM